MRLEVAARRDGATLLDLDRAIERSKGDQQSFVCVCNVSCWPEPNVWCRWNWCIGGGACCTECYWKNCIDNC